MKYVYWGGGQQPPTQKKNESLNDIKWLKGQFQSIQQVSSTLTFWNTQCDWTASDLHNNRRVRKAGSLANIGTSHKIL